MFYENIYQQHHRLSRVYEPVKATNQLGIKKIDFVKDNRKHRITLILKSNQIIGSSVNALITGNNLIIETTITPDFYFRPIRTHLINRDILNESMNGDLDVNFSEIILDPDFKYHVTSCQMMDSGNLQIILNFRYNNKH